MVIRDVIQGRKGGQKCQNLLSKKTIEWVGGGHKIGKIGRRRLWMTPKFNFWLENVNSSAWVIYFMYFYIKIPALVIKDGSFSSY